MRISKISAVVLFMAAVFSAGQKPANAEEKKISLAGLLDRVASLDWLYLPPAPAEKQVQFSSYDRKARIENGKKIDWFANDDSGNYLAEEEQPGGKEYLMADFKGPGVMVRIWSANPGRDRWRIYLDGSAEPMIDEPGEDLLSGKGKFFKEPFAGKRNLGYLLIFPIPFAKSCKVTLFTNSSVKPNRFYQVDIISLGPDTGVDTFQLDDFQEFQGKIREVADRLANRAPLVPADAEEFKFELEIPANAEKTLNQISGPGVIKMLEINFAGKSTEETRLALNQLVLTGKFDGLPKNCISAPLAAFFGSAPGIETYHSLASAIEYDKQNKNVSLKSYWPMPVKKSAVFSLSNHSQKSVRISGKVLLEKKAVSPDAMYFHADYHYLDNYPTRPFSDWTLLSASGGAGRYVGTMLSIRNPDYQWWGEGDEKVFVEGEEFPSIFGTGTEDYFSYAWGTRYEKFDHAYYGIPVPTKKGPLLMIVGFKTPAEQVVMGDKRKEEICSQYRWHILDQVPFHQSLRFDLEIWHWTPSITFDLQAMSYWYGQAGINYELQPLDPEKIPNW